MRSDEDRGVQTPLVVAAPILTWLLVLVGHDLRDRRLPNSLTVPGVLAVAAMAPTHPTAAAAVGVTAVPYVVATLTGGCGAGDLKLAVIVGALAGDVLRAVVVVLLASVLTLVAAAVAAARGGPTTVAHGPALAAAVLVVVL
ncbi:A24 family peptidase [Williamsia sp. SKLECPSW1]